MTTTAQTITVPADQIVRFRADLRRQGFRIVRSAPSLSGYAVTYERRTAR